MMCVRRQWWILLEVFFLALPSTIDTTDTHTTPITTTTVTRDPTDAISLKTSELIRLAGSAIYGIGRVEVFHGDSWTTICDDGWDMLDATVVCRMVGHFNTGLALFNAEFGEGEGNITMSDVRCNGTESSIFQCPFSEQTNYCLHKDEASVICLNLPHQEKKIMEVNHRSSTMQHRTVPERRVRLLCGLEEMEGEVEILEAGVWGQLCDDQSTFHNIQVICRSLGHSFGEKYESRVCAVGVEPMFTMKCKGSEPNISDCSIRSNTINKCNSNKSVSGVRCGHKKDQLTVRPMDSKLTDYADNAGRLTVVSVFIMLSSVSISLLATTSSVV
ncbi:neurotrypsin-like [Argonauta hians]